MVVFKQHFKIIKGHTYTIIHKHNEQLFQCVDECESVLYVKESDFFFQYTGLIHSIFSFDFLKQLKNHNSSVTL